MPWQSNTISPATTSPAADISKITNDLSVLRSVLNGVSDADVPNAALTAANNAQTTANTANTAAGNAQTTANAAIPSTQKGAANGVATLDSTGNVPIGQLGNVSGATKVPVRQTVMTGAVDGNGYANILSVGAGLIPKLLATAVAVSIAFAAGFNSAGAADFVGQVSADTNFPTAVGSQTVSSATNAAASVITTASAHNLVVGAWVTLSGFTPSGYNGTYQVAAVGSSTTFTVNLPAAPGATTVIGSYTVANFLYVDRNTSSGVLTLGSTLLAPNYQYAAASTTNGQHTFVIPSMQMYVGNGSTAAAVQRVFVGECQASSASISSVTSYAFNGMYVGQQITLPGVSTITAVSHNIGTTEVFEQSQVINATAEAGFVPGEWVRSDDIKQSSGSVVKYFSSGIGRNSLLWSTTSTTAPGVMSKTGTTTLTAMTLANWKIKAVIRRNF